MSNYIPSTRVVLRVILIVRLISAFVLPESDCDATYNYWEPLHYLIYGRGFQTWEYIPDYALRSYAYLGVHGIAAWLAKFAGMSKILTWYLTRCMIAAVFAAMETSLYAYTKRTFGTMAGWLMLIFTVFSAGHFHAAPAFLPSTWAAVFQGFTFYLTVTGASNSKPGPYYAGALAAGCCGVLLGWPFAGLTFVPAGLCMLWNVLKRRLWGALLGMMAVAAVVPLLLVFISAAADWLAYGAPTLAVWNIVKYNVLGGGGGAGSTLYGVEPSHWYALNLVLNWHVLTAVVGLAAVLFPVAWLCYLAGASATSSRTASARVAAALATSSACSLGAVLALSTVCLWVGFMSMNPHKEERFLFPVYPLLPVLGAQCCTSVARAQRALCGRPVQREASGSKSASALSWTSLFLASVYVAASAARVAALYMYYSAPLAAWQQASNLALGSGHAGVLSAQELFTSMDTTMLSDVAGYVGYNTTAMQHSTPVEYAAGRELYGLHGRPAVPLEAGPGLRMCVGQEWYRFPSSFFLPDVTCPAAASVSRLPHATPGGYAELRFFRDGFGGQLPAQFTLVNGTRSRGGEFNDLNAEIMERFVPIDTCDIIVDLWLAQGRGVSDAKPWLPYAAPVEVGALAKPVPAHDDWLVVASYPFLDADVTPSWLRAAYLPWTHTSHTDQQYMGRYLVVARADLWKTCGRQPAADAHATP